MHHNLVDRFTRILQNSSEVGGNRYLQLLLELVKDIEADSRNELDDAKNRLHDLLSDENMALDAHLSRKFIEELGEVHFHVVSKREGLDLVKIPERPDEKTPDFKICGGPDVYFEVKTPSVVGGDFGMKQTMENSWQGRIELENKIEKGQRIALVEQVVAPYGNVPHEKRLKCAITVLQNKIRSNIKQGQYLMGPTYLVCSLLVLHPYGGKTKSVLRPVFRSTADLPYYVSGHLWMTAFSEPGMIIHSEPEFAGSAAIEGKIEHAGILVGNDYSFIEGIIFVIYDFHGYSRMLCLVRSFDQIAYPVQGLVRLKGWNDPTDSNGWQLETSL